MVNSYLLSGVISLVFLVSYLFVIVDVDGAIDEPNGYPFLYVFLNAFSLNAVNCLTSIVTCLIFAGTLSYNLSSSRQIWAVSQARVLVQTPILMFHSSLATKDFLSPHGSPELTQYWKFPRTLCCSPPHSSSSCPSSTLAQMLPCTFSPRTHSLAQQLTQQTSNAIISLNLVCLMWTYMVSIGCVLYRRIYNPHLLPKCQWSLGKWGVAVNTGALLYSTFAFFWSFWPNETPVTTENFNWAVVMFVATFIIAAVDWAFRGRLRYNGPVVHSEGWKGQ